jgi:hypothetical protein
MRYIKNSPDGKGGQVFCFLKDVGKTGKVLSQAGGSLLSLTGIGAVASIANLAVSAVGFYYMNKKLNALRDELNSLHSTVSQGFAQMESRLVQVQYLLGELAEGQQRILEGQEHIKDQLDAASFAKVFTVMEGLQDAERTGKLPSPHRVDAHQDKLRDVRNRTAGLIEQWCRGQTPVESPIFARGTGYYQFWALSLMVEARLLRMVGETRDAFQVIERGLDWYMPAAQQTATLLLGDNPGILLSGAFKDRVSLKQLVSLQEFCGGEPADMDDYQLIAHEADRQNKEFFGRTPAERARQMRTYDPRPYYSRAVQAHNLKELGQRMESMAFEYRLCDRQRLDVDDWERAELTDESSGEIHLIPVETN